jgi:hypothetical protein
MTADRRRLPWTLLLGAALIVAAEALLAVDVATRGVAVLPPELGQVVAQPAGFLGELARWTAVHMTPLCWVGYLLVMDGLLVFAGTSPARLRPRRFTVCFVTSVGVWLFFDWVNFFFIHAWDYHGVEPLSRLHEYTAKFVAFGAISPAMFMTAALYQQLGLRRLRGPRIPLGRPAQVILFAAGIPALVFPFWIRQPVGSLTLWLSVFLLLDPVNRWFNAPSTIGDLQAGRYGRVCSLVLGGLTCGFFWEFWNYWAAAKWTYNLPFLGGHEQWKLFEMPLAGFSGFLPFALECWAVFTTFVVVMDRIGLRVNEPLPDHDAVL